MLYISSIVVRHFKKAVAAEVGRLQEIENRCGEEWPDDYDPNDLAIYRGLLEWLDENLETGCIERNPDSKPFGFMMSLVPAYVRENKFSISSSDLDSIFRTYCEYVVGGCQKKLPHALQFPDSSSRSWIERHLQSLIDFPKSQVPPATPGA